MRQDLESLLLRSEALERERNEITAELERFNVLLVQELIVLYGSQSKIARQLDVTPGYISRIASGKFPVTLEFAARVARLSLRKWGPESPSKIETLNPYGRSPMEEMYDSED